MTISLKNNIPSGIRFCNTQSKANEDIALLATIKDAKLEDEDILLFDRGITKTATYEEFTNREIKFVTRVKANKFLNTTTTLYSIARKRDYQRSDIPSGGNLKL